MIRKNGVIFTFVLLSLFLSISVPNVAALVEEKNMSVLTSDAENIIIGKVLNKSSYWENGNIFTDVIVSTGTHIKGKSGNIVTVKVPGGTVGNIRADVSDVPLFDGNEEVLLFLKDSSVVGWNQGKYSIQNNVVKETGEPLTEFVSRIEQNLETVTADQSVHNEIYSNVTNADKTYMKTDAIQTTIPHITNVTPGSGPSIAENLGSAVADENSTQVTINGYAFGSTKGSVNFWRVGTIFYSATIVSWTDTKIVVKVPGKVSSGMQIIGLGNVQVIRSDGVPSDNYGFFAVTYSYGGGKSSGNNITYRVNQNVVNVTDGLSAINAAANTWNNAGANFEFLYGGSTSKTSFAMDGENSIMWVNYDTGSIATTITWLYIADTKTIIESDIIFNGAMNWGTDGSSTKMDIQTVSTHELGHWLQLLDLYGSADSQKMMYGYGKHGTVKRNLDVNDIDGIRWIYGNNPSIPADTTPPITTISGVAEGAVYKNNVTITFVANDNVGGSGVFQTEFAINGGHMMYYSSPFLVNSEGNDTITYKSKDNAGNVEKLKQVNFAINNIHTPTLVGTYLPPGGTPAQWKTGVIRAMDDYFATPSLITKADLLSVMDVYFGK